MDRSTHSPIRTEPTGYFHYGHLEFNNIRLIRILPSGRAPHDTVCLTLEHHHVDHVKFDALSYTWGPSSAETLQEETDQVFTTVRRCYPLYCEGQIIRCTRSLRDALRRIRTYHDPEKARILQLSSRKPKLPLTWADGICINQEAPQERAAQVAMMGRIYGRAYQVLAYIGEADEGSRTALDTVMKIDTLCFADRFDGSRLAFYDREYYAAVNLQPILPAEWWEWAILLSRTWFQRTWVLQEVVEAVTRTTVICGPLVCQLSIILMSLAGVTAMDWRLEIAGEMRSVMGQNDRYSTYAQAAMPWLLKANHPFYMLHFAALQGAKPSFQLLSRAVLTQTRCLDPRDKIYATLSIAREWSGPESAHIPIDYEMSVGEVFARATKCYIGLSGTLDILSSRSERSSPRDYVLPTWVPDYDETINRPDLLFPLSGTELGFLKPQWLASQDSVPPSLSCSQPFRQLHLRGRLCDTIESSAPLDSFFDDCTTMHEPLQILLTAIRGDCDSTE